ncbi:MAG TPA: hypothetical protein VGU72_04420 [Beijerinckiaceae bacterium]|jgi:hypothetical protein|nr:hypothetical protein [Beijerinckiaceae bacterium]
MTDGWLVTLFVVVACAASGVVWALLSMLIGGTWDFIKGILS